MTDRRALIVIDVQNDFCPGGALAVPRGDEVVPQVNALMNGAGLVVLTQDWHPKDHRSFADQHPGRAPLETVQTDYGPQVLWPAHCVQGTLGAAFHPHLRTGPAALVLRKGQNRGIDSYSAFFENDRTTTTGLAGYLRERGVQALTLAGLALDFCVAWTALDAARLGFEVTVVQGACRAIDTGGSLAAAREGMRQAGVTLA